jgi:hypothetical protein
MVIFVLSVIAEYIRVVLIGTERYRMVVYFITILKNYVRKSNM